MPLTSLRNDAPRPSPEASVHGMRRSHARAAACVSALPQHRQAPTQPLRRPCRGRRCVRAAAAPAAAPPTADTDIDPPRGDTRGAALLVEDVLLSVGPEDLLLGAKLRVEPGECVGLVGANGCGKSTLLRCVAGIRQQDGGNIVVDRNAAVGYLEQTAVSGSNRTVLEEAKSRMAATAAAAALARAEAAAASAEPGQAAAAAAAVTAALDAFDAAGGPSAERRVASVLDGLGFTRQQWDTPCSQLSGGWQMRVALARLLLSPAGEGAAAPGAGGDAATAAGGGLLLLDEPSNHLDSRATAFLAAFLKRSGAATVLVSHDAQLLDGACDKLVEVRGKSLHVYPGGYASFAEERARRAAAALARAAKIDAQAAKLEGFITRFGAKATKATAAKSKQKALDKLLEGRDGDAELEAAAAAASDAGPGDARAVSLSLPPAPPCAADTLILRGASFGFGAQPQLQKVSLTLRRGMRVAVLGPNGEGKSTLLAALAGSLQLRSGERKVGDGASIGVFTQDLAQTLPPDVIAVEHVLSSARASAPDVTMQTARSVLGALGLRGDAALRRIGDLSGGEKARVALAAFVLRPANVLLLDEASNHLDAAALEALTAALCSWDGLLLAVTHNAAFAAALAPNHVVTVAAGGAMLSPAYGELAPHHWGVETAQAQATAVQEASRAAKAEAAAPGVAAFEARKAVQRQRARLDKLLTLIEAAEQKMAAAEADAAAAAQAGDSAKAAAAMKLYDKHAAEVEQHFAEAESLEVALAAVVPDE